jgi:lyso-ornithine lipid O-acyltransferase
MGRIRAATILVSFLSLTLPLMCVQFFIRSKYLPWYYHRVLCKILGMTIQVDGALPSEPVMIVSNHISWLDIPLLSTLKPLSLVAKREVGTWPLFGAMAKLQKTVFINRDNRLSTGSSSKEISSRLMKGDTLVLFPEGTSTDGTAVLPFKSALIGAVEGLDILVTPITIFYEGEPKFYAWYEDIDLLPHLWKVIKSGPIKARIIIHPALQETNRKTIAAEAEAIIRRTLGEFT